MKKTLITFISATVAIMALLPQNISAAKKNDPNRKEVQEILKELGEPHYIERMKISGLCSLKFDGADGEDDFYHIYNASMKEGGYRIIIFNNKPEYLGYYSTEFEGVDYEEGAILLDSGNTDADGNSTYFTLSIPDKGPSDKVRIDGIPTPFVKNPKLEEEKTAVAATGGGALVVPKETSASGEVIDYRDWTITMKGREITVNAIFVKVEGGKVHIKNAKNNKIAAIPGSALSEEDKEYVKRITAK